MAESPECGLEFPMFGLDDSSFDVDGTLKSLFNDVYPSNVMQMQKTEKSPYHESDSGVSDTSGEGPCSSCCEKDSHSDFPSSCDIPLISDMLDTPAKPFLTTGMLSHMLDIPAEPFLPNSSEIDSDVLLQSRVGNETRTNGVHVLETTADTQTCRKTRSQTISMCRAHEPSVGAKVQVPRSGNTDSKITAAKRQRPVSVSEDEIDIADDYDVFSRCKPKGSIRVNQRGERLPSAKNSEKSVTSVKVLRIVQSGNGSNAEDITKALEEKNRKNAEMARQNRLKKKEYIGNLEYDVEVGRKRIDELESALNNVEEERDAYKREVEYLKSVLANHSALAGLLKNIPSVSGVTLSSSMSRKRVAELDHSYTYTPRKKNCLAGHPSPSQTGVCLHVNSHNVSLEFCHHCSDMASGGEGGGCHEL